MDSSRRRWITPYMKQSWVSLPLLLSKICLGMNFSFTTCFMTAAMAPDSTLKADINSLTWFASSLGFIGVIGYVGAPWSMARYGRRKVYAAWSVPGIVGQLIIVFGNDINVLIFGRVLYGVTAAANMLVGIVYVGECSDPHFRAMFLNMTTAALNVGNIIVHTIGHFVSWRTLAIIITIPSIVNFLVACTCPESPAWLAEHKQYERSREAFYWLRGRTEDSTREIEELIRAQRHKTVDKSFVEQVMDFFRKFKMSNFWKPIFLLFIVTILLEVSGRHIFPSYSSQLLKEMLPNGSDTFYYNVGIDVIIVLSSFLVSYLAKVMKTRDLLFWTGGGAVLLLTLATISLYLLKDGFITQHYSWISVVLFALYFAFTNLGCASVPISLAGEIIPLEHRGVIPILAGCFYMIAVTVALKVVPFVIMAVQIYGAFALLAMAQAIVLVVLYFTLPETKGHTLQEIEDYFTFGRFRDGAAVPADDDEHTRGLRRN